VTSLTMVLIPFLAIAGRRLTARTDDKKVLDAALLVAPPVDAKGRAIVVGHGRVGQVVCELLESHNVPFLATDRDPAAVAAYRRRGREVYYGDATNPAFLKSCGVMDAPAVIVTIHDQAAIGEIVRVVRAMRPETPGISTPSASPTRCRRRSKQVCSCRRLRSSGWGCRPAP
jgi:CPA2 family monovalent cation:H+ antiporter-2